MAVTIKDIAREAGVSYSTVSRALNGKSFVEAEKKELILKLASEMGYIPNQAAINLKLSKSYTLGLYFSAINKASSPFVLHDVVSGVYSIVGSRYNVVVKGIDMHEPGTLNPACFDGMIVLTQRREDESFIEEVLEKKIPAVAIGRPVFYEISNVLSDETLGMEKAMDHLLENGHRKIAVIEGSPEYDSTKNRHKGWRHSVSKRGISPDQLAVEYGDYRYMSGYCAAQRLLKSGPTAILCFNDEMAFGAKSAIDEAGLQVPGDISLIGFDNWDVAGYSGMQLTTVERNMGEIAKEGTRILLGQLEHNNTGTERIYIDTRLIVRKSVKNLNEGKNGF